MSPYLTPLTSFGLAVYRHTYGPVCCSLSTEKFKLIIMRGDTQSDSQYFLKYVYSKL